MPRTNEFTARCYICREVVPERQGDISLCPEGNAQAGRWRVRHTTCAPTVPTPPDIGEPVATLATKTKAVSSKQPLLSSRLYGMLSQMRGGSNVFVARDIDFTSLNPDPNDAIVDVIERDNQLFIVTAGMQRTWDEMNNHVKVNTSAEAMTRMLESGGTVTGRVPSVPEMQDMPDPYPVQRGETYTHWLRRTGRTNSQSAAREYANQSERYNDDEPQF